MGSDLSAVRQASTIVLTTYRRDGTPVETPVSIAFEGDRAFFLVPAMHRLMRYQTMHYELRPDPG